jgi:hypothetical protein
MLSITKNMPDKQKAEQHQRWLDRVPEEYRAEQTRMHRTPLTGEIGGKA